MTSDSPAWSQFGLFPPFRLQEEREFLTWLLDWFEYTANSVSNNG